MTEDKYADLKIDIVGMMATSAGYGSFVIDWSSASIGFGTLTILRDDEGIITIKNEHMTPEFCKAVFCKLVDDNFKTP